MKILSLTSASLVFLLMAIPGNGIAMTDETEGGKKPNNLHEQNLATSCFSQDVANKDKKPQEPKIENLLSAFAPQKKVESFSSLPFFQPDVSLQSVYYGATQEYVDYLFENSSDFVAISGFNRFIKVNRALQEATGWSEEELTGNPFAFFSHPEDTQKILDMEKIAKTNVFIWSFESRTRCKDNSYRWSQWLALAKLTTTEKPEGRTAFCIGRDITRQKEQEEVRLKALEESHKEIKDLNVSLHEQNKLLQAISEIQSAYIKRKDPFSQENICEEDNFSVYYRTFELALQHFIDLSKSGSGFIGELLFDADQRPFLQLVFGAAKNVIIDNRLQQAINTYQGKGKKLWDFNNIFGEIIATKKPLIINDVKNYSKPIGIPQGHIPINSFLGVPFIFNNEVVGIIGLANRDEGYSNDLLQWLEPLSLITGRIMNEIKMEHWREEAEKQVIAREHADAANTAKSAFLAHMSHEIRIPLTGVLGLLDLINKKSLSEDDRTYLQKAQISGQSLMSLLNDILDISKIEAHQIKLEKINFNPVKVVQEVVDLLSLEARKQGTSLTITINPGILNRLIGDPTRLRQIFFNLIGNAVKFTKHGSVSVSLDGQESTEKNNIFFLEGTVTDTGIGMNPETQQRLFQSFSQADDSMMRQFGGTGLGLYITKKLCELMNGDIKSTSQFGHGSTFQFTVEMEIPEEQAPEKSVPPKKFSGLHALIAEDESVCQLALKRMLSQEGYSTTVVKNGIEALEAVKRAPYDLIFMNGEMPAMGGLEATRKIRKLLNNQTIPIIGVTAHGLDRREQFMASGMDGYLTKPVQRSVLKAEILRCLEESESKPEKFPNLHILIAEDNLINQLVLNTILQQEGCSTTVVENGLEAVEAIKRESYDLVLMDGEMPVMDGLEATRKIRQMLNHQTLPIIGVTAHALDTHREQFMASGMDGYLTKPVQRSDLKAEILRCLEDKKSA